MIEANVGQHKTCNWNTSNTMIEADIRQHKDQQLKLNYDYNWANVERIKTYDWWQTGTMIEAEQRLMIESWTKTI